MGFPFSGAQAHWRWVDLCEEAGIDSIWQTDRLISSEPFLESLTSIAALAGRTRRLKFGMNVLSLGQRDPVLDAKLRGAKTDEALQIIRRLWTEESVDFDGKHYRLSGAMISPKPAQPDLPIWIGGSSPAAVRRTARFGTGWQSGADTPEMAGKVVTAIKAALVETGRTIDEDHYGAGFPFRIGRVNDVPSLAATVETYRGYLGSDPFAYFAIGDADTIVRRIADYIDAGVSKFVLRPLAEGDADIMAQTEALICDVLPRVAARWPKPAA